MLSMTEKDLKWKALAMIGALYLPFFLSITLLTGHMQRLGDESLFFSPTDAQGYKLIADYYTSLGQSERPDDYLLALRPFMFPLYLGLYKVIGIAGVQCLQILMNVGSLWLLFLAAEALSKRIWFAAGCTMLLSLMPSLNFLAFYALTESLSLFLVCLFTALIVGFFKNHNQNYLFSAALIVSILLCIKPIMLPFWVLSLAYYTGYSLRRGTWTVWRPIASTTPVLLQLIITFSLTGSATLSPSGSVNIASWYFPAVYGMAEYGKFVGNKSEEAKEGLKKFPELKDKVGYIVTNHTAAVKAYLYTLVHQNLIAGSNFVRPAGDAAEDKRSIFDALLRWSAYLNRFLVCLHAGMAVCLIWLVVAGRNLYQERALVICYIFALTLMLPLGFPYYQGDRYMVIVQPLLFVAHAGVAGLVIELLRRKLVPRAVLLPESRHFRK